MNTCRWQRGTTAAIAHAGPRWAGVWSLLYTAGCATTTLAARVPLLVGAELTWAAMSLRWARDEVEHAHGELPFTSPTLELADLGPDDEAAVAGALVGQLTDAILERLELMLEAGPDQAERDLVDRVGALVRSGRPALAELAS